MSKQLLLVILFATANLLNGYCQILSKFDDINNPFISDIRVEQLHGKVKSITTTIHDLTQKSSFKDDDPTLISIIKQHFNDAGYYTKIQASTIPYSYEIKYTKPEHRLLDVNTTRDLMLTNKFILHNSTIRNLCLGSIGRNPLGNPNDIKFIDINYSYNNLGLLESVDNSSSFFGNKGNHWQFSYDDDGRLVNKKIYEIAWSKKYLQSETTYKWINNELVSEQIIDAKGKIKLQYNYSTKENKYQIHEFDYQNNGRSLERIITNVFDDKLQVKQKIIQSSKNVDVGFSVQRIVDFKIDGDKTGGYSIKTKSFQYPTSSHRIPKRWVDCGTINTIIKRDSHGNISYLKSGNSNTWNEWVYKYDKNGNWVERSEYLIEKNGETKIKHYSIIRNIEYYNEVKKITNRSSISSSHNKNNDSKTNNVCGMSLSYNKKHLMIIQEIEGSYMLSKRESKSLKPIKYYSFVDNYFDKGQNYLRIASTISNNGKHYAFSTYSNQQKFVQNSIIIYNLNTSEIHSTIDINNLKLKGGKACKFHFNSAGDKLYYGTALEIYEYDLSLKDCKKLHETKGYVTYDLKSNEPVTCDHEIINSYGEVRIINKQTLSGDKYVSNIVFGCIWKKNSGKGYVTEVGNKQLLFSSRALEIINP
jgi:hypothetical protein